MTVQKNSNSANNIVSLRATRGIPRPDDEVDGTSPSVKRKLSRADAMKKASKAFHNAKARCKRGDGVKFLFPSLQDFLTEVGLPPRSDLSLDRIDATGNYEHGNIRWTNKSCQSANKVASRHGSKLTFHQIAHAVSAQQAKEQARSGLAAAWLNACQLLQTKARHDQCPMDSQALPFLEQSASGTLMPSRAGNLSFFPACYRLPSLQVPNETVWIYARPGWCAAVECDAAWRARRCDAERGTVFALNADFAMNIHQNDGAALLRETTNDAKHGAVWFTRKGLGLPGLTSLETTLVSFGWQSALNGRDVAVLPALRAFEAFERCQYEDKRPRLDDAVGASRLIIPDLTTEGEAGRSAGSDRLRRLVKLVQERASRGLKTWVGVADPEWLPHAVAQDLLCILSFSEVTPGSPLPPDMPRQLMTDESAIAEWWRKQARVNVESARIEYE